MSVIHFPSEFAQEADRTRRIINILQIKEWPEDLLDPNCITLEELRQCNDELVETIEERMRAMGIDESFDEFF